ncbi:MAG TPA: SDR family oxidoreductase [Victivallales bacterium]|nr:SDR family oxidoreductase [Victivallales bacterium]
MNILLTGSSGLLGSDIAISAYKKGIALKGVCRHPQKKGDIEADITSEGGIAKIAKTEFDCIIHCAAWRDPDKCEKDKGYCLKINVKATESLAKIAKERNAFFIHISTDYVFSGENPPYYEDSQICPINFYGESKAQAELIIQKLQRFSILRVPLLYGMGGGIEKSSLILGMMNALHSGKNWDMEDSIVRFPTYTGDVADAVFFILEKKLNGIFHFSGNCRTSRYKMTIDFAKVMGLDSSRIIRLPEPPPAEARRPKNSQLSIEKIISLGFSPPLPFQERISILKDEIKNQYEKIKSSSN